ncbi:MAG TPA: septal ring lytic transglycosylase RlpA family protein [Stellaceae bacterium]|jgi:rare lipoprotein A
MVHHGAVHLCLAGLVAADVLFIGAVGMWPNVPETPQNRIVVMALEPPPPEPPEQKPDHRMSTPELTGVASWYGDEWRGRTTASGKPFDDRKLTAAHRTLPLNSRVRVINLNTGRSVEVTITDRGPYTDGRLIDLSKAAAKKLGMVKDGLVPVRIESVAG